MGFHERRFHMKRNIFHIWIGLAIALLVLSIGGMIYAYHATRQSVEFHFQVDSLITAAKIANNEEPLTDPDRAIIAEYEGKSYLIVPGNYTALSFYLQQKAAMPLFQKPDMDKAVKIQICDLATIYAAPVDEKGEALLVQLETGSQRFVMRVSGYEHWNRFVKVFTEGTYHDDNIPLD